MNPGPARWYRQAGRGKYASPERERRFRLVADPPPGAAARRIEDRYIAGTRLRLRHVEVGAEVVHKLTQKVRVRDEDPVDVSITNGYLPPEEHALLAALPARTISKTRSVHPVGEHDEEEPLAGVLDRADAGLPVPACGSQRLRDLARPVGEVRRWAVAAALGDGDIFSGAGITAQATAADRRQAATTSAVPATRSPRTWPRPRARAHLHGRGSSCVLEGCPGW